MNKTTVVNYFSSQRKIALALGVSEQAVSLWGDVIPERAALKLERLTGGELKYDASLYTERHKRPLSQEV
jgi:hypothetical protein